LVYFSRIKTLNISEIQIDGNKVIDTEALKTTVEEQISGKYLWLFPKTNILFYPENSIKKDLQEKFSRLKDIKLSIKNNKVLVISLTERTAKYTWCGNTIPETRFPENSDSEKCYFLDEDGYIFDEAPYFSGEIYFKFYGLPDGLHSESGYEAPEDLILGSYFSKQNFQQLILLKDNLISFGLKPFALYIKPDQNMEIFLSSKNSSTLEPKILIKTDIDFQNVTENLEAALTTEPLQSEFKNKYSSLLYIDLRFGNKVYYKFK
jgi:hypothetical protein